MQLDIFEHSRDIMLKNDVVVALERRDATVARKCRAALFGEYPDSPLLLDLNTMIDALEQKPPRVQTHLDLATARQWLEDTVEPATLRVLGSKEGQLWLAVLWKALATSVVALPFHPNTPLEHAAPIWLRMGEWVAAATAVKTIESWRRKPIPLSWMLRANLELAGLQANLGMLAELAWISPRRLEDVVSASTEPLIKQLVKQFEASFTAFEATEDLVWFPAWVLTERPNLAASFALAQPSNHSPAEKSMRIMIALLGLERQGRHHDIVAERKHLKDVNEALFMAYMKSR
jgi:hypothetical protein